MASIRETVEVQPDRSLRWPLVFVSLLLPFAVLTVALDPFQLPKESLFHLGAIALLGAWLWSVLRRGAACLTGGGAALPLLLFLFIGFLSVFQAPYKGEALSTVRDAAYAALVYFLAASSLDPRDRLVPGSLGLAALATAWLGLSQLLLGPVVPWLPSTMGGALVGDVSTAAIFVAIALPLAWGLAERAAGVSAWLWGVGSGGAIAYVVLSRTRGAWVALAAGSLAFLFLRWRRRASASGERPAWTALRPLLAGLILTIALVAWGTVGKGVPIEAAPPSFKTVELQGPELHAETWRVTSGLILSHPLGAGAGNWRYVFGSTVGTLKSKTGFSATRIPGQAGNEYLQVAAELGAVGLALLLWAGLALARTGLRRHREGSWSAAPGLSGLAALSASAFLANPLREQPVVWAGVILAALSVAVPPGSQDPSSTGRILSWSLEPRRRRSLGAAAAVAFLLLAALTVTRVSRSLLSSVDLKLGQAACARGDFDRGLAALGRAAEAERSSLQAHSLAASCALQAGRAERAEKEIRAALKLNEKDPSAWFTLAAALKERGSLTEAIAACEKARGFFPNDERVNILLGELRRITGDTVRASQAFNDALEGNPSSVQAYLRAGDNLMGRGQIYTAVTAYAKAANLDPYSAEAVLKLGGAHMKAGDYDSAVSIYQSLLDLTPDDPVAHLSMAGALAGLLRPCEAVPFMERAREMESSPSRRAMLTTYIEETAAKCRKQKETAAGPP